jgi:glycosyltransferase involved in cell wall biosynthesis
MRAEQITVVIPTYRRPRLLARALESVLQQGLEGVKVSVFDNASGDETEEVVQAFSRHHQVRYHRHPTNIGYDNIQYAINAVDTEFIAILNDDDIQLPGLIHNAMAAHDKWPSIGAYCGLTLVFDDIRKQSLGVQGRSWRPGFYPAGTGTSWMVREHLTPTGVVFATQAIRHARFEFSDSEMMARLSHTFDLVVDSSITGAFAVHPSSWTQTRSLDDEQRLALKALQEFFKLESLSTEDRVQVLLRSVRGLAFRQYNLAHADVIRGDQSTKRRKEMGQAALLLVAPV